MAISGSQQKSEWSRAGGGEGGGGPGGPWEAGGG